MVPFPVNTSGQTSIAPLGGEAWTVPLTADEAKMTKAAELVKCMNTDENQVMRAKEGGLVPTKLALAEQFKTEVPEIAGFVDAVGTARARTGKLGAKWPETAKTIYTGMQLVLTGQASSGRSDGQGRRELIRQFSERQGAARCRIRTR